ncbi:hypothetical protein [Pseudoxanthomonas broegbernensis]|uniref:COG3904 family protein n=1 Tax=Pseudoxanthomonas broegbernensis TaxID=83619 RepID=UPI0017D68676|nr:hypothetical protein [Pseudoxanthomonas broegbernensis]MBB6064715.1 hypothetical protein [Pseudoxanthomonas broegbernensis]
MTSPEEGGAVSRAPMPEGAVPAAPAPQAAPPVPVPKAKAPDWSPMELTSGQAWIGCALDYDQGDGEPVSVPSRDNLRHLLEPCVEGDVLRLRWRGKVASDFTALVERVTRVADALDIGNRVLDLDSTGGQVEDAIRAGDWIGRHHWTLWVREDSVCHSACVFVLAGGDSRMLAGRVGIHRIIRLSSTATNREELNTELQAVYATVRAYLERNGASPLLADAMKTVPNRSLRLLTVEELRVYGLDGNNAAQDDLDRVRLLDKCGDDFMHRRDAWVRAFGERCRSEREVHALNACGLELRRGYGFPDEACPAESPLAEFNALVTVAEPTPEAEAGAGAEAAPAAKTAGGGGKAPAGQGG